MQTKENKRPAHCTHALYPLCGCVAPKGDEVSAPVPADLLYKRDLAAAKPRVARKPGRPKHVIPDEHEDFLSRLPLILDDPSLSARLDKMVLAEECRRSLSRFCREAWQVIEPATKLEWNWHHELLCSILQGIFEEWEKAKDDKTFKQQVNNALFNVPPGTGKSRVLSCFFPTWCWVRHPGMKFLCLSTNEDASLRDARDSKGLINSEWFQDVFQPEWKLQEDQEAISNFANDMGGVRISKGQGAKVIGLRADCIEGSSEVLTEHGPVTIRELHEMPAGKWPRVWALNHETSVPELRVIQASKKVGRKPTVVVRTNSNDVLRCTDDHKIWTSEGYKKAAHLAGSTLSILPGTVCVEQVGTPTQVQPVQPRHADLRSVPGVIHEAGGGSGEVCGQVRDSREANVLQGMLCEGETGKRGERRDREAMPSVRCGVQTRFHQADQADVLGRVSCRLAEGTTTSANEGDVPVLRQNVSTKGQCSRVLLDGVQEQHALHRDVGERQPSLQGSSDLPRRAVGSLAPIDTRAGSWSVRNLPEAKAAERQATARSPHRREPCEQPAGELADAVRRVPHGAPQVSPALCTSVSTEAAGDGTSEVDVYDIQVEGLHNFFARGVSSSNFINISNCLLIDDPNDPTEVESKTKREGVNVLWKDTIYNRVNHPERSVRIGIQQRTHEEDWSGYVLKQEGVWHPEKNRKGWLHVCLPAEFEPERRCVTPWGSDPRTVRGEPLHWSTKNDLAQLMKAAFTRALRVGEPLEEVIDYARSRIKGDEPVGRLSPDFLGKERLRLGGNKYSGLMQQRPTAAEGGTVKLAWWRFFQYHNRQLIESLPGATRAMRAPDGMEMDRQHPTYVVQERGTYVKTLDFDWTVISIDAAAKRTERGSQHGILVVSGKGPMRFIRDDRTCRGDILDVIRIIKELCAQYDPDRLIIEAKAMGNDLATLFRNTLMQGDIVGSNGKHLTVRVEEYNPGAASKEARLDSCLPEIEAGLVYVQEGAAWLEPFLAEVCGYPNATHDDRPDALSQALNVMRSYSAYQLPSW